MCNPNNYSRRKYYKDYIFTAKIDINMNGGTYTVNAMAKCWYLLYTIRKNENVTPLKWIQHWSSDAIAYGNPTDVNNYISGKM